MKRCTGLPMAGIARTAASSPAMAQDWPKGPVRVVVPFDAGSTPDLVARVVAKRLAARLGQPMIVDNKSGASGSIGTDAVAKAAPDGQTIGVSIAGPLAIQVLGEAAIKDKLRSQYMDPVWNAPGEFRALLTADVARWKPMIHQHRISLD